LIVIVFKLLFFFLSQITGKNYELILILERIRFDLGLIIEANSITRIQNFLLVLILSSKLVLFELLIGPIHAKELSNKKGARINQFDEEVISN
jgi:hypothetical protein